MIVLWEPNEFFIPSFDVNDINFILEASKSDCMHEKRLDHVTFS